MAESEFRFTVEWLDRVEAMEQIWRRMEQAWDECAQYVGDETAKQANPYRRATDIEPPPDTSWVTFDEQRLFGKRRPK